MNKYVYDNSSYPSIIPQEIKEIISYKLDINEDEIKPNSKWEEIGADSLDFFEILMETESKYGIAIL